MPQPGSQCGLSNPSAAQAMQACPGSQLDKLAAGWLPLLLAFAAAGQAQTDREGDSPQHAAGVSAAPASPDVAGNQAIPENNVRQLIPNAHAAGTAPGNAAGNNAVQAPRIAALDGPTCGTAAQPTADAAAPSMAAGVGTTAQSAPSGGPEDGSSSGGSAPHGAAATAMPASRTGVSVVSVDEGGANEERRQLGQKCAPHTLRPGAPRSHSCMDSVAGRIPAQRGAHAQQRPTQGTGSSCSDSPVAVWPCCSQANA